jgi:hypothetical protein
MRRIPVVVALLIALSASMHAQTSGGEEAAIRSTITAQVAAWNRGDIPAFMQTYENSPETTFLGSTVSKGYEPILERYKKCGCCRDRAGRWSTRQ